MKEGKIIAIVGSPRSGKSFLARKLASHWGAKLFLEGEEGGFPTFIEESIAKDRNRLERQLWFRTMLVKKYLEAKKLRDQGLVVVLDAFWFSTTLYVDTLLEGFEKELMQEVLRLDQESLGFPDLTIFLQISEEGIREFIKRGGRSFDQSEAYLRDVILPVNQMHSEFFAKPPTGLKLLTINRDGLDFEKASDFEPLVQQIETTLN